MQEYLPHHVLLHTVAPIGAQLIVEIDRGAAGGDLDDQLRGTVEVIIGTHVGAVARGGTIRSRASGCGSLPRSSRTVALSAARTPGVAAL